MVDAPLTPPRPTRYPFPMPPIPRPRLLALALLAAFLAANPAAGDDPPNVVFVLADDMGVADAGCYGSQHVKTPHIDRLAREGMRFTEHYAGAPVCGPSRSCFLVGQHTGHAFQRGNPGQVADDSPFRDLQDAVGRASDFPVRPPGGSRTTVAETVAEIFRAAGYHTAVIGKWGLGNPGTPGAPRACGFDEFFGLATHVDAHTYHPEKIWDGGDYVDNGGRYVHDQYRDRAVALVERREAADAPFFLYLAFQTPHSPHGREDVPELEPWVRDRDWPGGTKVYASQIARMDRSIGALLDALERTGQAEDTVVLFASDNGPAPGHVEILDGNGPYRGWKRDFTEGGIRSPLLARWPGRIEAGSTSDFVSAFWDFLPTFAELIGRPVPDTTDGVSLLPVLLGESDAPRPREAPLYFEWSRRDMAGQAVRRGKWKLIRHLDRRPPRTVLYDLAADPGEETDLAGERPGLVRELTGLLEREHEPNPHFPLPGVDG